MWISKSDEGNVFLHKVKPKWNSEYGFWVNQTNEPRSELFIGSNFDEYIVPLPFELKEGECLEVKMSIELQGE